MSFFEIGPRQDYASYSANETSSEINAPHLTPPQRRVCDTLQEYLGNPPRKPGKKGDLHVSASRYFVREAALELVHAAAQGQIMTAPVQVVGRESEKFAQVWILNFVDCLDMGRTVAAPSSGFYKDKIGVIKRPAFDKARWDGSDLFVVPQDPSYSLFCTERFVELWQAQKLKGALFSRFLMDPNAVRA